MDPRLPPPPHATRHVVLLRGVNVGRARRLPMARLREQMGALGWTRVETVLNSGNAVFDAPAHPAPDHARALQQRLCDQVGVDCEVIVKTAAEFAAACSQQRLPPEAVDDARVLAVFTQQRDTLAALGPLTRRPWGSEVLALGELSAWLWCAGGVLDSPLWRAVDRLLGARGTARNRATVQRLLART